MSSAVVFVFMLDNVPGFHGALNETLYSTFHANTTSPHLETCNNTIANEILTAVSKETGLHLIPAWNYEESPVKEDLFKEMSPETLYDLGTVFEESIELEHPEDQTYKSSINHPNIDGRNHDDSDCEDATFKEVEMNETKLEFPKSAPFLVAIFETLSNVTAQTCAGTLVSPRWVLTAASCLNLLGNLYANGTNSTEKSRYTIIAGSTNPLSGGTAHNVTKVLLNPDAINNVTDVERMAPRVSLMVQAKSPFLALMRIDPEISEGAIRVVEGRIKDPEVMVYGWILAKNETGVDTMNSTSMLATVLTSAECKAMHYTKNNVLCLFNNDRNRNISLLSSGGPVLVVQDNQVRMLAVAQTDEHIFVAYAISAHLKWIQSVLNEK